LIQEYEGFLLTKEKYLQKMNLFTFKKIIYQGKFYKELKTTADDLSSDLYVVGGCLRDFIIGHPENIRDIDFASDQALKLARKFSKKIAAPFILLDEEEETGRVVIKSGKNKELSMDFSQIRGKTIFQDIYKRDFTINAMAIAFNDFFLDDELKLIDPLEGIRDIGNRSIKTVSDDSFTDDPLRMLRAFRFATTLNFTISLHTFELINLYKEKIIEVSGERIEAELFKMFDSDHSYRYLRQMDEAGLLEVIIPEIKKTVLWVHKFSVYKNLEKIISEEYKNIFPHCFDKVSDYIKGPYRKAMLKFALLLYGQSNSAENICRRLKMSNYKIDTIAKLIKFYPDFLKISYNKISVLKFFRKTGDDGIGILLISLAEGLMSEEKLRNILKIYLDEIKSMWENPRLISGDDLSGIFGLIPGPDFKKILQQIEEKQLEGIIKTRDEALRHIEENYVRCEAYKMHEH